MTSRPNEELAKQNVIVKESPIHGLGVFATKNFESSELILVGDESRIVTPDNPLRRDKGEYEYHCDYLAGGKVILLPWPERHVNHRCDPNAYVKHIDGIRYDFARRQILAGEEITHDYCINGFGNIVWYCKCGCARCRKIIHADFFHLPLELQIEYLPLLDDWYIEEYREKVEDLKRQIGL